MMIRQPAAEASASRSIFAYWTITRRAVTCHIKSPCWRYT